MVLRPAASSAQPRCPVQPAGGSSRSPFSCLVAFFVPSKSKAPQQAISLAPWLPSGIMRLPGRHRWWSGPARPPARASRPTTTAANRSGRLPVQAGDHLQAPPRAAVPGHASFAGRLGALTLPRRARRWRRGLLHGPDSLPGCSRRWSHRPARPAQGPGSPPWGRSAADVPKRWALAPASFAAPGRCSRAFPIQPRRD
jgi:hypothetical protein